MNLKLLRELIWLTQKAKRIVWSLFVKLYMIILGAKIGKNFTYSGGLPSISKIGNRNIFLEIGNDVLIRGPIDIWYRNSNSSIKIGNNVKIDSYCRFCVSGESQFSLSDGVKLGSRNNLSGGQDIEIGTGSQFGSDVSIYSSTHSTNINHKVNGNHFIHKDVKIGKEIWVGSGTTILPGIKTADRIIIGCNSVVNKPLEVHDGVYAGSPARLIKVRQSTNE